MTTTTYRTFLLAVVTFTALIAQAQTRRMTLRTTEQSLGLTITMAETIDVYDCHTVDTEPAFPGGNNAMVTYINSERRYPAEAYRDGIEGRVLCGFVVQPDGRVTHVNVLRGVEPSLDHEAVRIIGNMPVWEAGTVGGSRVPVYCILPVIFRR